MKKFLYPLIFSVGFIAFWFITVEILNATDGDGYGALGVGMLCLIAWIIVGIPIHCIRYSKLIVEEKLGYLYAVYNCLLIVVLHHIPFGYVPDAYVSIIFSVWVLFWGFVPLTWRILSRKYESEEEQQEEEQQEKQPAEAVGTEQLDTVPDSEFIRQAVKIISIFCIIVYMLNLVINRKFAEFIFLQNFKYIFEIIPAVAVFATLVFDKKRFWLKKQLLSVAFASELIYLSIAALLAIISTRYYVPNLWFFAVIVSLRVAVTAVMFLGSIQNLKRIKLLKYGAIAAAVSTALSTLHTIISYERIDTEVILRGIAPVMFYFAIIGITVIKKENSMKNTTEL